MVSVCAEERDDRSVLRRDTARVGREESDPLEGPIGSSAMQEDPKRKALSDLKAMLLAAREKLPAVEYYQLVRELSYWAQKEANKLEEDL